MRIISIGLYNPIPIKSGGDSYVTSLLNPLAKDNDVIHYYFLPSQSKIVPYSYKINFQTKYLNSQIIAKFQERPKLLHLLRPDLILNRYSLRNIKGDIIICDTFTFHVGYFLAKKNKARLVLIKQNIEWIYLKSNGSYGYIFLKPYEHYTLRKADAIVTITLNDYSYFSKYIDEKKIYYIPPNLNKDIFKADGSSYDFGDDKLNLLFYGSLDRPMNIEALKFIKYNLIPLLKKMNLLNKIRINIFGSGIPPESLQLNSDQNINFLGLVDDPGRYVRGADLIIVPVLNPGGMKIRVLEALLCGKPVVVTPEVSIGVPDEFKDFIYVEKDVNGFFKVIEQFLNRASIKKINTGVIEDYLRKNKTMNDVIYDLTNFEKNTKKNHR